MLDKVTDFILFLGQLTITAGLGEFCVHWCSLSMGPLQLKITWYQEYLAGEQAAHWDIQNKAGKFKFEWIKSLCFGCLSAQPALQHGGFCTM